MTLTLETGTPVLTERMRARRLEIEQATLAHVSRIVGDKEVDDGVYPYGLQRLVKTAIAYGYEILGAPSEEVHGAPVQLLRSARKAARRDIPLDVVLRGYLAGQALFADYVIEEAGEDDPTEVPDLHLTLRGLSTAAARIVDEVSTAYAQEQQSSSMSSGDRLALNIERILAGSSPDTSSSVNYDFGLTHTGFIAFGESAARHLNAVAAANGYRLLIASRPDHVVWAWLGSLGPPAFERVESRLSSESGGVAIACGESLGGLDGWRLTHQQARLALPFALNGDDGMVQYADVALSAAMLRDKVLFGSVRRRYLTALEDESDGGVVLRETLRAFWAANRNVSSAAAALRVHRHTVKRRIQTIEERFGRPLYQCEGEVEAALKLEKLGLELEQG